MDDTNIFFTCATFIITFLVIGIALMRKKNVKITDVSIGPVTVAIEDPTKNVDNIEILSSPIAACINEILTPPLKILLKDSSGIPISSKKVRLELHDENGLISYQNYGGKTSATSDTDGIVLFDDLTLSKTGRIRIFILADAIMEHTDDIDIFPPGLEVDFWNEEVGSQAYEEKLNRILRFTS